MTSVAVIGGGVSGLTAAYRLRRLLGASARITVLESSPNLGGKLRTVELGGSRLDLGAESFLARRPEVIDLVREIGLGDRLAHPTGARATVRAGGQARALPAGTVLGVPASADAVAGLLSADGLEAVRAEPDLPALRLDEGDLTLGPLLRSRFGDELVDRLVEPLLGGVYSGGTNGLGLRAAMPGLAAALAAGAGSLTAAAATQLPANPSGAPVFGTVRGGLDALTRRLAEVSGARIRLGCTARELAPRPGGGWRITLGAAAGAHAPTEPLLEADAVLLAVPPPAARRLLTGLAPVAATALGEVELASMVVVGLALPPGTVLPESSGTLIGSAERAADGNRFAVKAFTYTSRKWAHYDGGPVLVRGSLGHFGEPGDLRADDAELIRQVRANLAELAGVTATPLETTVMRWGGGLPQYAAGHVDRVERMERAVAGVPGLAIAGASLHGVGVAACVATATAAAGRIAAGLRERGFAAAGQGEGAKMDPCRG